MGYKIDWFVVGCFACVFAGSALISWLDNPTSEEIRDKEYRRGVKDMALICVHTSERPYRYEKTQPTAESE